MPSTTNIENELHSIADQMAGIRISDCFESEPSRASDFRCTANGLVLDYSKHRINALSRQRLLELAKASELSADFDALTRGEAINITEERAALHTLLRGTRADENPQLHAEVKKTNAHLEQLVGQIHSGARSGFGHTPFTDVVNIGIGGSDFGPKMVCRALRSENDILHTHFVANVDPQDLDETLAALNPQSTLFIICSKSFTTEETLTNALRARAWLLAAGASESDINDHMIAVTTNLDAASSFGVGPENCFPMWDWVGGRYSLWSSIGLPIALSIGYEGFIELLEGAYEMDQHFLNAPLEQNMPVVMALIGIWYINFLGAETQAVIPYDQALHQLPAFLQQLDMESNGKSVDIEGNQVDYATGPIVWGQTGSNGQHAFFQLLHQGTRFVPIDFIGSLETDDQTSEHHFALLTNMLAQANAFMNGDHSDGLLEYQTCPGNRPSNVILLDRISPRSLGALIALYEHKVFVQGAIWNINSFDQWGVQLGKRLANEISQNIDESTKDYDQSTQGLMKLVRAAFDKK